MLIYGALPTRGQLAHFELEVLLHGVMHADAKEFFGAFRYDAHPMAMLTSAFAYLGSYYGEANPSLQGGCLYSLCRMKNWTGGPGRPDSVHEVCQRRPGSTSEHGQADIQAYWQSDHIGCVRLINSGIQRTQRISGWLTA